MRKLFTFGVFVIVASALVIGISKYNNVPVLNKLFFYSPCDQPIHYRVDIVDPKFNLPKDEFMSDINQAKKIWSDSVNKKLFVYDPKGDLSVNLIYDERQTLNNQVNQLENTVKSGKQSLNPKIDEYDKESVDFKKRVGDLNKKIEDWNSKGGAPEDEYKKIVSEQQSLQEEASRLNSMAQSLNVSTREYNLEVKKLNQTITTFNDVLEQRPEEGIFKGPENRIEIYFNVSNNELIHTLAHELGHALGLGHSQNPKAIMFSNTNQSIALSKDDALELKNICRERSIFELIQAYISQILAKYKLSSIQIYSK